MADRIQELLYLALLNSVNVEQKISIIEGIVANKDYILSDMNINNINHKLRLTIDDKTVCPSVFYERLKENLEKVVLYKRAGVLMIETFGNKLFDFDFVPPRCNFKRTEKFHYKWTNYPTIAALTSARIRREREERRKKEGVSKNG